MPFFKHGRFVNYDKLSNTKKNQNPLPEPRVMSVDDVEKMEQIRYLYIEKGLTAKEVCKKIGGKYSDEVQTRMGKCLPKNLGHGGKRK